MEFAGRIRSALAERYHVDREIGRGGMGVVFRATDRRYGRAVAIKVLRPEVAQAVGLDRFEREIQIEAQLQHPAIIPLLDSGAADGLPYFVMPFVEGETLRERLRRDGPLPLDEAVAIADQVADALGYAHARGVVHRDIKPENILLSNGHTHVADFGIARVTYQGGEVISTSTGLALGTPHYMSPEQATASGRLDGRSDLYSLACVLFEMLCGEPPFGGVTQQAVISKHLFEPPPLLETLRPTVTPVVSAAVLKGLAKVPADRYATATEFRAALHAHQPVYVSGAQPRRRVRRRRVAGLALAAGLVLASAIALLPRPPSLADHQVMVFPLATTGNAPGAAEQGWNAALAIEIALEQTEPLKWLDGWQFMPQALRDDPRLLTRDAAVDIARAAGARYFITGAIRDGGDTAESAVTLWLTDAAADTVLTPATSAGIAATAPVLALRAMAPLLSRLVEPGRSVDLSPLTRLSQAAIALTLQGNRAYRRAQFLEALHFYQRALAADSLSALAAVMGAQAASWAALGEREAAVLIDVALRTDSLLPPKYREFVRGLDAYYAGSADSAIGHLNAALAIDREWAEAWMALGEVYYHLLPRASELDARAEDAFRRAVAVDSLFSPPLVHLAEISARQGDLRATREFAQRFRRMGTDSTYAREIRFLVGCLERGPEAMAEAGLADSVGATLAAMHLAGGGARPDCAEAGYRRMLAVADLPPQHRVGLALAMSGALMAGGRYAELAAFLDSVVAAGYRGALSLYPYYEALGAPPMQGGADAERLARTITGDLYERAHASLRWALGLWQLRHGDRARAAAIARSMDATADSTGTVPDHLFADALNAHVAAASGDTAAAFRRLARLHGDLPQRDLVWTPANTLAPTRLLQIALLTAVGHYAEADSVAELLDRPTILAQAGALPNVLAARAAIAASAGQARRAAAFRARLERLRASGMP